MRLRREDKVIVHGEIVLDDLSKVYGEGISYTEYTKLLKEYKVLFNRYLKTIKSSDNAGINMLERNINLNNSLDYTINIAREKLMKNVDEHKKTKEITVQLRQNNEKLVSALKESYVENDLLLKKINYYLKTYGDINHKFYDDEKDIGISKVFNIDFKSIEYSNENIKTILSLEIARNKESILLTKTAIMDYYTLTKEIKDSNSILKFVNEIYLSLRKYFSYDVILTHNKRDEFYLIHKNKELGDVENLMKNINNIKYLNSSITFSSASVVYKRGEESIDLLLDRCEKLFKINKYL